MSGAPREWRDRADELARRAVAGGEPTAWFEPLYAEGDAGTTGLPWDHDEPSAPLVAWAERTRPAGDRRSAVVVGAGLGVEAAYLAGLGFDTVGFDVSPTAVRLAAERNPLPGLRFEVADLFALPRSWIGHFDLVVEVYTVQALPRSARSAAVAAVRSLVAPGGTLLAVQFRLPEEADLDEGPPWPPTRAEMAQFAGDGLDLLSLDEVPREPGGHHWVAELHRPR